MVDCNYLQLKCEHFSVYCCESTVVAVCVCYKALQDLHDLERWTVLITGF